MNKTKINLQLFADAGSLVNSLTNGFVNAHTGTTVPFDAANTLTPELKTFHQLSLSWGVHPVLAMNQESEEKLFRHALDCAKQIDVVKRGDTVVILGGAPLNICGNTNMIKVVVAD
jgi:pyruvate kinase